MNALWPWLALAGLGCFHGLNPGMGWLFAAARGLQARSSRTVLSSMVPIAAGHALAVAAVVVVIAALRPLVDFTALQAGASLLLIGFGIYRLTARHRGRAGMQIGAGQLLVWSAVMATAHGAGLMLIPVLLRIPVGVRHAGHAHGAAMAAVGDSLGDSTTTALAAVGIHTLAMFATAGAIAIIVYKWVGLAFLRRGWVNFDLVWSFALIATGVGLLGSAMLMRVSPVAG